MLRVDESRDAALFLSFRDGMDGQSGLTGGFGTVNLDDTAFRESADAQCRVQTDGSGGNDIHLLDVRLAHAHDGAFSERFFEFFERGVENFQLLSVHIAFDFFFFHS